MKDFTPCEHGSHPMGCIQCQLAVQPPATPQEPGPSGSLVGYMESLMTRRKAVKLLEALAESCDRPDGEDHDWHECRSCVAAFSLTQPGEKALLRALLAELTRASNPSPERQTWQPIETAPKDTAVLLWLGWMFEIGHFNTGLGRWAANWATHWMPLPSPPTPGENR
jgi:hypothetical protein